VSDFLIDHEVYLGLDPGDLLKLVYEPDRYTEIEPALASMRWSGGGPPQRGARATVVTRSPFRFRPLRQAFGAPAGTVLITDWQPPTQLTFDFDIGAARGTAAVKLRVVAGSVTSAVISVVAAPSSRAVGLTLSPLRPRIEALARRALDRGAARIAAALAPAGRRAINSGHGGGS
jgi:hypothetical protein